MPTIDMRPLAAVLGLLVCGAAAAHVDKLVPVTDAMLENPDPADWLSRPAAASCSEATRAGGSARSTSAPATCSGR
ncbi:MAG TPA: hypothetical protein VFX89_01580 [Gammaproteobacteria bacterium]|nr:hypothetical protein [Gammaproteobacteria bacterium]